MVFATKKIENLIYLTSDSMTGYEEAANLIREENYDLSKLFTRRAEEREALLIYLQELVETEIEMSVKLHGTVKGSIQQLYLHIRSLFQKDCEVVMEEMKKGDRALAKAFERAIVEASPSFREILKECLYKIEHDEKTLKVLYKECLASQ